MAKKKKTKKSEPKKEPKVPDEVTDKSVNPYWDGNLPMPTDTQLMDALQRIIDRGCNTGMVAARFDRNHKGFVLEEVRYVNPSYRSVRDALTDFLLGEGELFDD